MAKNIFNWTFTDIEKFLKQNGFTYSHVRGSHYFYTGHYGHQPRIVQVPFHGSKTLKPRTMKGIIKQSGIPKEKWFYK